MTSQANKLAPKDSQDDPSADGAMKMFTSWVVAIADRVRNPVAGLAAALEIFDRRLAKLSESSDTADLRQIMTQIKARIASLDSYVGELQNFAKPVVLNKTSLNLSRVIAAAIAQATSTNGYNHATKIVASVAPVSFHGDQDALVVAVSHLLKNALEATAASSDPCVDVRLELKPELIRITIADNGTGFSPERLAVGVGQPFVSSKLAGTGLGLAIAERLIVAHAGTIELANQVAGGACVSVVLPRVTPIE